MEFFIFLPTLAVYLKVATLRWLQRVHGTQHCNCTMVANLSNTANVGKNFHCVWALSTPTFIPLPFSCACDKIHAHL